MRRFLILTTTVATVLLANPAAADLVQCTMTFDLSGWSFGIKSTKGEGKVTCSNDQSADVKISSGGAGLTVGKSDIVDGNGTFSDVKDISEIFGTYVALEGGISATKGGGGQVMTKGEISLAISGSGRGWEAGASLGGFTIERK
jgi:hypothetical protein